MRISYEDISKTDLSSPYIHFESIIVRIGMTNTTAAYMKIVGNVFKDKIDSFVWLMLETYSLTENYGESICETWKL